MFFFFIDDGLNFLNKSCIYVSTYIYIYIYKILGQIEHNEIYIYIYIYICIYIYIYIYGNILMNKMYFGSEDGSTNHRLKLYFFHENQ